MPSDFFGTHEGARPRRRGVLNETGRGTGVQNGVCLFGEDWVKSVGARLNRLSPWRYLGFERTWETFTVVQFGREGVRESGKCCGESVEGSGVPSSRVQREIYPTNVGGDNVPEAKKLFALAVIESV